MERKEAMSDFAGQEIAPAEDMLIVELDDRLEFSLALIETDLSPDVNIACNTKSCTQNFYQCS